MDWTCVSQTYQHGLSSAQVLFKTKHSSAFRGQVSLTAAATALYTFKNLCRGFYLPLLITDLSGLYQDL